MANDFTISLGGTEDVIKQIKDLVKAVGPEKAEPILLKGARKLAKAIRAKAPPGPTGNLKKAVKTKQLERWGKNPAPAIAAIDRKRAAHAHLVEYGHALVRSGKVIGHVPAHPFWRPAIDANFQGVLSDVTKGLNQLVEEAKK